MSEQDTEQEPSIEEILASIRQIISDDDEDGGDATPAEAPADKGDEDVVELTDTVETSTEAEEKPEPAAEEPAPEPQEEPEPEPTPEPEPEPEETSEDDEPDVDDLDIIMEDIETAEEQGTSPPQATPPEPQKPTISEEDALFTDSAENAAYEGFTELVRKTAVEHDGITIEEIVRTELRPLLKDWLNSNLPSIIERLVQEELERVAKRAVEE